MTRETRRLLVAAVAAGLLVAAAPSAYADRAPGPSLTTLQHRLETATRRAQAATDALTRVDATDSALREALDEVAAERWAAQRALDGQARVLYESRGAIDPVRLMWGGVSPQQQILDRVAGGVALDTARSLGTAAGAAAQLRALQRRADALRAGLAPEVAAAVAAQDTARAVLAQAEQQAADLATRAALDRTRAALDAMARAVTLTVAVDAGPRGRAALDRQRPVLALLEQAGGGYPAGYAPTGQVIEGHASWYGPGFVGNPTASGAPYDPEQLTCAMLAVPLGTVVHVTDLDTGRSVDMLVTDRGPYVGGRVLDSSHAGAVALGYDGVADVRIEVLAPAG